MRRSGIGLLLLALSAVVCAEPAIEIPAGVETASLRLAETTGLAIFERQRAATVALDQLGRDRKFKRDRRVQGWIAETTEDLAIKVIFVGARGDKPLQLLYQLTVASDGSVVGSARRYAAGTLASESQSAMFAAKTVALKGVDQECAKRHKAVVLERQGQAQNWVVYLLPEPRSNAVYPIGGSFRVELSPDGQSQLSARAFAKSCIDIEDRSDMFAFMLSHILDPHPTEIHVYANLRANKPVYVVTVENEATWVIKDGQIATFNTADDPEGAD